MTAKILSLNCSATGGVEQVRRQLVAPLIERGWQVGITLTPTATTWLSASGEIAELERLTGLPVRSASRLPSEPRPHPQMTACAVVPASATTTAKLALGLGDNQALTQACEAIGTKDVPVLVFPLVNAAHARHPAWPSYIDALRSAGVHLVYGDDIWPLREPRAAPYPTIPWASIVDAIDQLIA